MAELCPWCVLLRAALEEILEVTPTPGCSDDGWTDEFSQARRIAEKALEEHNADEG